MTLGRCLLFLPRPGNQTVNGVQALAKQSSQQDLLSAARQRYQKKAKSKAVIALTLAA